MAINKLFSILIISSALLSALSLAQLFIANKINEKECYKNILQRNHLRSYREKTLTRADYICKKATSSVPGECYKNILHRFSHLPSEETLDNIAKLCTTKNSLNAIYLDVNKQ